MRLLIRSTICLLSATFLSAADDVAVKAIQDEVHSIMVAIEKEDAAAVLNLTHEKIFEMAGGKEALKAALVGAFDQWKKLGMQIKQSEFPAPPTFHKGTVNEFVIVPTRLVIVVGDKTVDSTQYQLGARKIGEAQWHYVDGSKLTKELVLQLFPDFPKDVALPEKVQKVI